MANKQLWHYVTENAGYKVVAFFVTLILWITILGRRDFTLVRDFNVNIAIPEAYRLVAQSDKAVQVRVSGSRMALKKFSSQDGNIEIEVVKAEEGIRYVTIPIESIDLPFGVRVQSITPARVQIQLVRNTEDQRAN